MKAIIIGDPHFKVGNVPESEEMTRKLVEVAKERQPKFIVCLGDILHRHETIHVSPLMRAEHMIKELSKIAPTFLIIGNHDRPNNSNYLTDEHPFNSLKDWDNTYIVDKVMDVHIDDKRYILVPYVPPGKFEDALNTLDNPWFRDMNNNDPNFVKPIIFAHQEFYGAKMGAIKSQAGDKWSLDKPLVISGHVHDYDRLQENMIYVGTPIQSAWGESLNKAVSLFTFGDNYSWEEERIDLGLIKKVIVYLKPEDVEDYVPPEDKLVKLVIRGDDASIKMTAKLEKIKELKRKGINVVFKTLMSSGKEDNKKLFIRMGYKDSLYSTVNKDPDQLKWFNELF